MRRLYPAYLGSVAVILVVVAVRSDFTLRVPLLSLARSILKWCMYGMPDGDLPDVNGVVGTTLINAGVVWTLKFEWLFCLVLPFLGWFTRGPRFLLLLAVLVPRLLPHSLRRAISEVPELHILLRFLYSFGFGFLPGIAAAKLSRLEVLRSWTRRRTASLVPPLLLAAYVLLAPAELGPYDLFLIVPFALVAFGADALGWLSTRPLQLLGRISFSVYLLHAFVSPPV